MPLTGYWRTFVTGEDDDFNPVHKTFPVTESFLRDDDKVFERVFYLKLQLCYW